MARLFSKHHDKYHLHKTLGLLALLNFVYRAVALCVRGDAFRGDGPWLLWGSMLVHVLLHATSFSFALPQRRNPHAPMIWPTYRAHNAVFATRNVIGAAIVLLGWLPLASLPRSVARIAFVWTFMALADLASWYYDRVDDATTRGMPYPSWLRDSSVRRIKSFYMQCQFHATLLSVTEPNLSFMSVFPIQLASFAMTLARKHKITALQWHIVYAAALWSLYAFMVALPHIDTKLALAGVLGGVAKEVRHHLRANKYLLWAATIALHDFATDRLPQLTARGETIVRFLMFVAAARQFIRLSHCFLTERSRAPHENSDRHAAAEATNDDDDDDGEDEEVHVLPEGRRDSRTVYRVNRGDKHPAYRANGYNRAVAPDAQTVRDKRQ